MREISRFQMNVAKAAKQLKEEKESESGLSVQTVFQRFSRSGQEPLKIACALFCFFSGEGLPEKETAELERYIRIRIRNIVEALIEEDAPEKIEQFFLRGWFGRSECNTFIQIARERKKLQSLIYLCTLKNDHYGYQEQEWKL